MSTQGDLFDVGTAMDPPLKWAGGKRWLLPLFRPLWRAHAQRRLVEPFCGGASVTLGLRPRAALLNDLNVHVVNFFHWLQRGLVVPTTTPMANDAATFYGHRAQFNALVDDDLSDTAEAAALFYYLNKTGFNGLCRFNRHGHFNVPFGQHVHIEYRRDFTDYVAPLASWAFTQGDFEGVPLDASDFVYADPPYDGAFASYSGNTFSWTDHVRLAVWLSRHPGPVVVSNAATERVLGLYTDYGFTTRVLTAQRRISCTGDRTPAREVLATRNVDVPEHVGNAAAALI